MGHLPIHETKLITIEYELVSAGNNDWHLIELERDNLEAVRFIEAIVEESTALYVLMEIRALL